MSRFERVKERIEARIDKSDKLLDDMTKYAKWSLDEIYRFSDSAVPLKRRGNLVNQEVENENQPELLYGNVNLLALGGATATDKRYNIAKALRTEKERTKVCIDPKRTLCTKFNGEAADEARTKLCREAAEIVLGDEFFEKLYNKTLRLVNQRMREKSVNLWFPPPSKLILLHRQLLVCFG